MQHWYGRGLIVLALFVGAGMMLGGCSSASPGGGGGQAADDGGDDDPGSTVPGDADDGDTDAPPAGKPVITTLMGTGFSGNNGDGRALLETQLYLPVDVEVGEDGAVYVVDWNNHRIRQVKDGVSKTIAGTGQLTGEDTAEGVATEVKLNHPTHVSFDREGRLLISVWHNSAIKRLDLATGLVENIAGTGGRTFGGDGGPAKEAKMNLCSSAVVDSQGNIYISDQANQRIRMIDAYSLNMYTVCGTGEPGYSGDDGPAELAQINSPFGQSSTPSGRLGIDKQDRVYIADTNNHVIRMIDTDRTIKTIVGTGIAGYGGDGGPATEAQLHNPADIDVAPDGTLYIADVMNQVIRKVTPDGIISTFAGTGERGFSGDGAAADGCQLDRPYGVDVAPNGDVYIADTHNNRIRVVSGEVPSWYDPNNTGSDGFDDVAQVPCSDQPGTICTFMGQGQIGFNGDGKDRLKTVLYWPFDIEFTPSGKTYVNDWNNHRMRELLPDQTLITRMGNEVIGDGPPDFADLVPPGAPSTEVSINHLTYMTELPDGKLLMAVWHNHKLRQYDPVTGMIEVIGGRGPSGNMPTGDGGPVKDALFDLPDDLAFDKAGNLFILDQKTWRIRMVEDYLNMGREGIIRTVLGTGERGYTPDGMAPLQTKVMFPTGANPEPNGGLIFDENDILYYCDSHNQIIRRVEFNEDYTDGVVTTVCGTGEAGYNGDGPALETQLDFPQDLEWGPDGRLYFPDANNNIIRALDLETGMVETVVGNHERGYAGDGGMATEAALNRPFGIAFDAEGDLYVCDTFNSRIRKVNMEY